jgi:hypothetical protein
MVADDDLGDFWDRARAEAHARGSLFMALSVNLWEGYWHWRRGELAEAVAGLETMLEQERMWGGSGTGRGWALAFLAGVQLDRGDVDASRAAVEVASAGAVPGEGGRLVRHAVARLQLAEGRHAEALATLDGTAGPAGVANPAWNAELGLRAAALAGLGRSGEAVAIAEREVALLRRWGAPSYLGSGLRRLGELAGGPGVEALREAVAVLATTTAELERARAEVALGRSPAVPDAQAVPLLQAAVARARACGAQGVLADACHVLGRRGHVVEAACDDDRDVPMIVRRVADLAGEGLTVHEVAQRLFLTPGTVRAALARVGSSEAQVGWGRLRS